jgi:PfaB family protein
MGKTKQVQSPKIAIVGMDTFLGSCNELDAFERSIYEGNQHFIPLPSQRWQELEKQGDVCNKYDFENWIAPSGAYIQDFEIDALGLQISPDKVEKLNHEKLLMLKVADNALKDAGLNQSKRVAVVIVTSTELSVCQSPKKAPQLESISIDNIDNSNANFNDKYHYEDIIASCISNLWDFAGPSFTLPAEQNSVFNALDLAQKLLVIREVDAVLVGAVELAGKPSKVLARNNKNKVNTGVNSLSYDQNVNGWMVGEGATAVVLQLHETAKQDKNRVYAVIDAISISANNSMSEASVSIAQTCQQAFQVAKIKPTDINYLEVFGSGVESQDESEIQGLIQAYRTDQTDLSCAIGSVKANFGHTYSASGLVSLVKTALCLYYRYIPGVPQWSSPKKPEMWQNSPFYVATESKPWFLEKGATRRIAAVNSIEIDGSYAHVILSEEANHENYSSKYLEQNPFYLFAIAADNRSKLLEQLSGLQKTIADCSSLSAAASQTFAISQQFQQATYALGILGRDRNELIREIQRSFKGINDAFETGKDWQTPVGSYFTAKPLGKQGKVAFVYPGAFNSYVGLARNLFRLFPKIYDDLLIKSVYNRVANIEKLLYPRSLKKFSKRQLEVIERRFIDDPVAMLESEIGFAGLMTTILKKYFQIKPESAFGYSLGEISMMFSQGIWNSFHQGSSDLNSSPLFRTELSGAKNAVRKYWGLPLVQNGESEEFWSNYVLMCPVSRVREVIKHQQHVYLTLINTPNEVVIAGDTQACQRVIEKLNCDAIAAPFKHVIHCEPVRSKYDELVKINTLPLQNLPETVFYFSAEYKPIVFDSQAIARNIAKALCQEIDFPHLINRVYEDGTKIFIEVGAGSNCSRWIDTTLKDKEHVTVSLNKRSIDDCTSIVKALAKLLSHRVEMDLSPLYSQVQENSIQNPSMVKLVTLGSSEINSTSLSEKKRTDIKDTSTKFLVNGVNKQQNELVDLKEFEEMNSTLLPNPMSDFLLDNQPGEVNLKNNIYADIPQLINLRNPLYQKLTENTYCMNKIHSEFLHKRQESLQQISAIIQIQQDFFQKLIEDELLDQ